MNRKYSALALSAIAMGAVAFSTTEASAKTDPGPGGTSPSVPAIASEWPEEGTGYPGAGSKAPEYNYPNYDPKYEVAAPVQAAATSTTRSDDNGVEAVQSGASALGGAALAFGGLWLYRRRQLPAA
jgi:hypothetical protein